MLKKLISINPYNGEEIAEYEQHTDEELGDMLAAAKDAQISWAQLSIDERGKYITALADHLLEFKQELAVRCTWEMGKPLAQSIAELEKCATSLKFYVARAAEFLAPQEVKSKASKSYVCFEPLGTVLAIMPWNFPYWQVYRALGPILMSGNAMVLKHASNVTGCAMAMQLAADKCLPTGVFTVAKATSDRVANMIAHPSIAAITLTGSSAAGKAVASEAAKNLKKQVLELGGSDPYVILADADVSAAAKLCVKSRMNNSGQSCIAAKRFIVVQEVLEEFTAEVKKLVAAKTWGDPMLEATDVGPQARADLRDELHKQVMDSIAAGAELQLGGELPNDGSALYPPTLLSNVQKGMPAYDEELFGPVAAIIPAADEADALIIANDSLYGLGGAIFSKDVERATQLAHKFVNSGTVCVNDYVSSNPLLPFGGVKESGYGRELSHYGMLEFCNVKTIWVK